MLRTLRLKVIRYLMTAETYETTRRALLQGTDIWFECTTDPAMQMNEDDRAVVEFVKHDIDVVSKFWRL